MRGPIKEWGLKTIGMPLCRGCDAERKTVMTAASRDSGSKMCPEEVPHGFRPAAFDGVRAGWMDVKVRESKGMGRISGRTV